MESRLQIQAVCSLLSVTAAAERCTTTNLSSETRFTMWVRLYLDKNDPEIQNQTYEDFSFFRVIGGCRINGYNTAADWSIELNHLPGKLPGKLTPDDIKHCIIRATGIVRDNAPAEGIYEEDDVYATVEVYKGKKDLTWSLHLESPSIDKAREVLMKIRQCTIQPIDAWAPTAT